MISGEQWDWWLDKTSAGALRNIRRAHDPNSRNLKESNRGPKSTAGEKSVRPVFRHSEQRHRRTAR